MTDTPARPRKTTLSRPAPLSEASTWGPYFDALFPPQEVSPWIAWKIASTGVGIARRLWDQREQLRGEYEDVHGTDRARWPPPVLSSAGRYRSYSRRIRTRFTETLPRGGVLVKQRCRLR
jgi:hypothetical protein